ncbi:hypothetical protein B0H13DRAFT_2384524 [Mycena leptocephala]|nr:hypothetical protein B0H13DRAFT_2384524 [Mycena leptocephala]
MTTHTCWVMLVLEWGNPLIFINTPWTMVAIPIQCGIVASMVQIFFARRIWLLGKGRIMRCITVLVVTLSLIQCASALALTLPLPHATFILTATVLSAQQQRSGAVGEVQMAYFVVVGHLFRLRSQHCSNPGFSKSKTDFLAATNTLLDRLIMRTIQSGVITAAVAALHIVMVLKYPNIFLDLPPSSLIFSLHRRELYANIVFANLNGRKRQMQPLEIETSGISLEFRHRRNLAQSCTTGRDESTVGIHSTNVHITTEIENSDDYLKKPTLRM